MNAKTGHADHYIDGKNVAKTSAVGDVDYDFDLAGRVPLSVTDDGLRQEADIDRALLLSSATTGGHHRPVIDIDVPARLVPSSTPGHAHLYLDVDLTWDQYLDLLKALNAAGLVETGYVLASMEREATHVRLPWVKKAKRGEAS